MQDKIINGLIGEAKHESVYSCYYCDSSTNNGFINGDINAVADNYNANPNMHYNQYHIDNINNSIKSCYSLLIKLELLPYVMCLEGCKEKIKRQLESTTDAEKKILLLRETEEINNEIKKIIDKYH